MKTNANHPENSRTHGHARKIPKPASGNSNPGIPQKNIQLERCLRERSTSPFCNVTFARPGKCNYRRVTIGLCRPRISRCEKKKKRKRRAKSVRHRTWQKPSTHCWAVVTKTSLSHANRRSSIMCDTPRRCEPRSEARLAMRDKTTKLELWLPSYVDLFRQLRRKFSAGEFFARFRDERCHLCGEKSRGIEVVEVCNCWNLKSCFDDCRDGRNREKSLGRGRNGWIWNNGDLFFEECCEL